MNPRPERVYLPLDGLLLVDKPAGRTSHDVVAAVRRRFSIKKVGHGGTLDPLATGLLVLLLGRGTRLFDRVCGAGKTYEGTLHLGVVTDTQDREGQVLAEADPSGVTEAALRDALVPWRGDVRQTPPMVSALKRGGQKLCDLARAGKTVALEPRPVTIHALELLEFTPPTARLRVQCGKGVYVRTLAHDIGQALGCGGHLAALRRTVSGPWRVEDAHPLDTILQWTPEELAAHALPLPAAEDAPA
jgi:tRNA pseudouridine55 synthase